MDIGPALCVADVLIKTETTPVGLEPTASEYRHINQLEVRRAIHCATEPVGQGGFKALSGYRDGLFLADGLKVWA